MIEKQYSKIGFTLTSEFLFALDKHLYDMFGVDFSTAHVVPAYSDNDGDFHYSISHYVDNELILLNLVIKKVLPLAETNKTGNLLFRLSAKIEDLQSKNYLFLRNKFRLDDINQAILSASAKIQNVHSSMPEDSFSLQLEFFNKSIIIAEGTCQIKSRKIRTPEIKDDTINSLLVKAKIKGLYKSPFCIISSSNDGFSLCNRIYKTDDDIIHFNYDFLKIAINYCAKNEIYFDLCELENYDIKNIEDYLLVQQMVNI